MENTIIEKLESRINQVRFKQLEFMQRFDSEKIFSVPLFFNKKLVFKVPHTLTLDTFQVLDSVLKNNIKIDVTNDKDIIAEFAATILLQYCTPTFKHFFKYPLKKLLKKNVDSNKSLALVDLLYTKFLTQFN